MAVTCLRATAATFTLAILLSVSLISFEVDFWSWGGDTRSSLKNFFADAAPLSKETKSEIADVMTDIDLHGDGKEQHDREIMEQQNSEEIVEPDLDRREVEDVTSDSPKIVNEVETPSDLTEKSDVKIEEPTAVADDEQKEVSDESKVEKQSESAEPSGEQNDQNTHAKPSLKRRSRAKTFLVVFMGHSGSTAFTTELRTHSDFLVELLEPLEHGEYEFNTDKALSRARELMDRGIAQGKIPGFKIRPFHVSNKPEVWREFVKEYDTRIIWQYRENIMKQAVGEYRNRFLNDTSVVEGLMMGEEPCKKGSGQICKFKIDNFPGLHGLMNDFSTSDELLTQAVRSFRRDNEMHMVRYEDYLYNREETMKSAFDFLGVDYQDTRPDRRKASPDSLCEMVTNFQELCDRFVQCQLWRPFLTDERNGCRCEPGKWQPFDSSFCHREVWYQKTK